MRYLPLTSQDRNAMLERIGVNDVSELFADVPPDKYLRDLVNLPLAKSEFEVQQEMNSFAGASMPANSLPSFVGCGIYHHHVPATVDHLIQRSEFLTSYTPYQPEISQGTLQALFEFQTQVTMLTGMEIANASMYDGSTASAEAVLMANRITKRNKVIVSGNLHPHYRELIKTLAHYSGAKCATLVPNPIGHEELIQEIDDDTSCIVVQFPDFYGHIRDLAPIASAAHSAGALLVVVVTEIIALGLLQSPGSMGADIVAAEGQSIGNGLNFGGPHVGLLAAHLRHVRHMPGRICGETLDAEGRRGFVLTLSTREQHIRREKATSNICTNSGLCALAFTIHLSLLGQCGLKRLSEVNHANAITLADSMAEIEGVEVLNRAFFNEFTIRITNKDANDVVETLAKRRILCGVPVSRLEPDKPELSDLIIVAATETNTAIECETYVDHLKDVLQ
ncbi:MAG: aminomethyl-transferring glycine dehydrogenase subunit GcvPA [Hyphomicrobiaceae bacterium]|nr:aminomethyl-transferring glycine dehydrogenase subunit GcvPA [Hyphomicrobiaceae bacterium]